jgi:hypothetical protein
VPAPLPLLFDRVNSLEEIHFLSSSSSKRDQLNGDFEKKRKQPSPEFNGLKSRDNETG